MKKIKLHDIPAIHNIFAGKLANKHFSDFKLALKIAKVTNELGVVLKSFQDQERKVFDKYMKKGPDGNFIIEGNHLVPKKTDDKFILEMNKEINDLHNTEIELDTLPSPLVITDANDLSDITPNDLIALDGLLDFDYVLHEGECEPEEEIKPNA